MLQQFKTDFFLRRKALWIQIAVQLVSFLVGITMVLILMGAGEDLDACMGTLLSGVILISMTYFGASISYPQEFMLALSMGRTRGSFMGAYYLRAVLQLLLGWVILLLLYHAESAIYQQRFPLYGSGAHLTFLTDWRIVSSIVLLFPALPMCMGALYGRFGKKGYTALYLIWLFFCFIFPRMFQAERGDGVLDQIATGLLQTMQWFSPALWLLFGAAAFAGMLFITIKLGMEQMVS